MHVPYMICDPDKLTYVSYGALYRKFVKHSATCRERVYNNKNGILS